MCHLKSFAYILDLAAEEWAESTGSWPGAAPVISAPAPAVVLTQPLEFELVLVGPDAVVRPR